MNNRAETIKENCYPIYSAIQIRNWEDTVMKETHCTEIDLVQQAAAAFTDKFLQQFGKEKPVQMLCGNGNNGADGWAIAALLKREGVAVSVFADSGAKQSNAAEYYRQQYKAHDNTNIYPLENFPASSNASALLIDALFGLGLNRPFTGMFAVVIKAANNSTQYKIAVDLPSGMSADTVPEKESAIFCANETFTFQSLKKTMLQPETAPLYGKITLLDLGFERSLAPQTYLFAFNQQAAENIYRPRPSFSHKGTFGKVLIAAGSYGKMGAAVLATRAALHTGAGLTTTLAPSCGHEILQISCPEAMFTAGGEKHLTTIEPGEELTVAVGPGIGTEPETAKALEKFLKGWKKPCVLDADALNLIAKEPELLNYIPAQSILTPHPKEFERLFSPTENSMEQQKLASEKAAEHQLIIILKGHRTQVILPDGTVCYNTTGNAGMAKGGSGDVLTGMLVSLLAQNYSPAETALFGVWLHGAAGDVAAARYSQEAMLPGNLIDSIGEVFRQLAKKKSTL
ncbi:NAD(P)H-hydrate dehydratase [Chryseobacterium salipaludis]|uniref:NAD(P)H-hydrate dehydratase n=1 Tax=Chryseobacterium TaxID=59732 RepID=UPI001FF47B96|nr:MULTISPECIES: NAD(P)H-hydrate dehydratase [Chryseobacterium]MCJ8497016.1 NAD(P)H-hydrate dehydratase [Chryseobacterium salipaludis]MCX3296497.1 NAD(P)H-hydrate dehydratase [Planobacterium sp. JC490]